jgi:hypothetical protein
MGPLSSPPNVYERKNLAARFMLPSVISAGPVTSCYQREPVSLAKPEYYSSNPRNFRISELARQFQDMRAMSAETALQRLEF